MSPLFIAAMAWIHAFLAVAWVGSSALSFAVLGPVISSLAPESRAEFAVHQRDSRLSSKKPSEYFL